MITKKGSYRSKGFIDWGVSTTKNGFPRLVTLLRADEIFDPDLQRWVDLDGSEEMTGYFTLVDGNGKMTLNATQVKKTTGWTGSFSALNNMDLSAVPVQFRVDVHLYEGQESLQINWIDEYDAVPGAQVKKLDENDLKALDARYAGLLKGPVQPASAPVSTPAPASALTQPKKKPGRPAKTTTAPAESTPELPFQAPAPAPAGKPVPPPRAKAPTAVPTAGCTKEGAWDACYTAAQVAKMNDDDLGNKWVEVINQVAPGKEDESITAEEWSKIRGAVSAALIPF
jgi:hypothetical protein